MRRMPAHLLAAALAGSFPFLLAYNLSPSSTGLNQLAAFGAAGVLLAVGPGRRGLMRRHAVALSVPLAAMALLVGAVLWSAATGLPAPLAASSLALMIGAPVCLFGGAALGAADAGVDARGWRAADALWGGLLLAGVLSALVGLVQVFAPAWPDGNWIAPSRLPGRAVGNLRQPNHLSTLLLWALIALVALLRTEVRPALRRAGLSTGVLLVAGVVLTASRTGVLGIVLLLLWGAVDRRLPRSTRWFLIATPAIYLGFWGLMDAWSHLTAHTFGGEQRLAEADLSSSRFGIWANTVSLIRQQPWTGVGWGEFNRAWTLTAFPDRPIAFFDHCHNLVLQLLVELGIPLGGVVVLLMVAALVAAFVRAWPVEGDEGLSARAAAMLVLLAGLHSQFEYPLWYAYFLFPTVMAWGLALGARRGGTGAAAAVSGEVQARVDAEPTHVAASASASASTSATGAASPEEPMTRWHPTWLNAAGVLMIVGAAWAVSDYRKVVDIYVPPPGAGSLPERIAVGQRSVFFSHLADYAAATNTTPPSEAMAAFDVTTHALLDTRLMIAWATALDGIGKHDQAAWLVARLREFRRPETDDFLAECTAPALPTAASASASVRAGSEAVAPIAAAASSGTTDADGQARVPAQATGSGGAATRPFQCGEPRRTYNWRDF